MKKFFAAALVVSMLTVLLSGCMCQVADTTFQFDGSGTVEAKFGFSEEMVNAMNMRAEMTRLFLLSLRWPRLLRRPGERVVCQR